MNRAFVLGNGTSRKNLDLENLEYGEAYDRIEDILLPIYMLHRYQIESADESTHYPPMIQDIT